MCGFWKNKITPQGLFAQLKGTVSLFLGLSSSTWHGGDGILVLGKIKSHYWVIFSRVTDVGAPETRFWYAVCQLHCQSSPSSLDAEPLVRAGPPSSTAREGEPVQR